MSKRKVFVVWDSQLDEVRDILDSARAESDAHALEIKDLCASDETLEGQIHENVVAALNDAKRVVAITDRANANVGFELGHAWGKDLDVVVAGVNVDVYAHAWLSAQPLSSHAVAPVTNGEKFLAVASRTTSYRPASGRPSGDATLVVCTSEGTGDDVRKALGRTSAGLRFVDYDSVKSASDLDALLCEVGTVVWVIPRLKAPGEHRDHPRIANDAIIAGFALARGRTLKVFRPEGTRPVADVGPMTTMWNRLDDLCRKVNSALGPIVTPQPAPPRDVLETYFDFLRRRHARLIPFGDASTGDVVEHCYVEVCVGYEARGEDGVTQRSGRRGSALTSGGEGLLERLEPVKLEKLLADRLQGRFLLAGEPGAGKSTLVRHLAFVSADAGRAADGPLVVFVSLSRWAAEGGDLFDRVEQEVIASAGEPALGLAARLRELSATPGRLWLFLDGLDEVRTNLAAVVSSIVALEQAHHGALVVTTRPRADAPLGARFEPLSMRPLGPTAQRSLLAHWLTPAGFDVDEAWRRIQAQPRLAELAGNPLMLTLLAILVREREELPPTRVKLYERAVDVLLSRWHESDEGKRKLKNVVTAKRALPELALWLQQRGGEVWDREVEVEDAMWAYKKLDADGYARVQSDWPAHADFLDELHAVSGLFGPLDGDRKQWRFLHRSFREYLAAVALARRPDPAEALVEPAWQAANPKERRPHELTVSGWWGETCAMLAGLVPKPIELLTRLHAKDKGLLERVVRAAEKLPVLETVECLWGLGVRGDLVPFVVTPCHSPGHAERDSVATWLWAKVVPKLDDTALGALGNALEQCGVDLMSGADRERFFAAAGRPAPMELPTERFAAIPSGTFLMGSPDDEEGRFDREGPQHEVTISAFGMMKTSVTVEDFRCFNKAWKGRYDRPDFPVTNVTWWSAWLFARWSGATLPTEAQWEYSCRGGTPTRFWSGNTEADLAKVGWYSENSENTLHAVGLKGTPAHRWGLLDLHGNVWEWCLDGRRPYGEAAVNDPTGPFFGDLRAVRGGTCRGGAVRCRSAYRNEDLPEFVRGVRGLRLVRPAPRAPTSDP